ASEDVTADEGSQTGLAPGFNALLLACVRSTAWQQALRLIDEYSRYAEGPLAVNNYSVFLSECEQQGWEGQEQSLLEALSSEWLWAHGKIVAALPLRPRYAGQWK
ncbi:unnamed protein product, partial [Symbiodinium sp. KB8]